MKLSLAEKLELIDKNINKILIMKSSALGDVVRTFPAVVFLRGKFPDAHIAFLVGEMYADLLAPCPHIQEIIPYKKRRNMEDLAGFVRFTRDIRKKRFDLVLNFQNTKRFDFIAKMSGAAHISHIVDVPPPMNGVEGIFEIMRSAGLEPGQPEYEFWFEKEDLGFAEEFIAGAGLGGARLVGLNPGVAWPSRRWPLEHFAALADRAQTELGVRCVIFGGADEAGRAETIASLMKTEAPASAAGKTAIRQAAAIIRRCAAFVSNDSGLMHIAAMNRVPTIGLFGPSTPDIARPCGTGHKIRYLALPCAPCYKHECPSGDTQCMDKITPGAVFEDLKEILSRPSSV